MDRVPERRSREVETPVSARDQRRSAAAIRRVVEPAARLCAAARVLVRHKETLDAEAGDRLLAEIDAAADVLQGVVSRLVSAQSPADAA